MFDINNGNLVKAFPAQAAAITAVAVHPNQQEIAAADGTGIVKIYKISDGTEIRELKGHQGAVTGLSYSSNSANIVTAGTDKTLRIWNAGDGKEIRKIDVGTPLTCVAVSWNNSWIAVGGTDKQIHTYNLGDGKPEKTFAGHTEKPLCVEFTRDNQRLLSSAADGTAKLWDWNKGDELQTFVRSQGNVVAAMSPDNRTVITGGKNKELFAEQLTVQAVQLAEEKGILDLAIRSPSDYCLTAGEEGSVKMWNAGNFSPFREFAGHQGTVKSVAFSPNNQQVAAGGQDKLLILWNLNSSQMQYQIPTPAEVTEIAFSPDSKKLLAASADNVIRSYDPEPPNPQPAEPPSRNVAQSLTAHTKSITSLVFLPDNRLALSASSDGTVKTWSIAAAGETARLNGHGSQIYGLAFSPDGKTLASASADKTVRLWDLEKNQQLKTLSTQAEQVYSVAFSPDGKFLLTGGGDNTVRLINVETGAEARQYHGPKYAVYSVAFSPDGKRIAAGGVGLGEDRKVFLWDVESQNPVAVFTGHKDDVYRVQFSPDGKHLLSAGYAGTINLWKPGQEKPIYSNDLPIVLYSAAYSPDGSQIAIAAGDGKTYLIDLPNEAK